ncbi:MAG TPA: 5-oxoprolinase subunit PxpB [Gemmatimonadaceae bacterium]|nr:5-oxoprolinase subunit PxpB [Gemmatimonadaceae bacterium]
MKDLPTIVPLGDEALLVTFAETISWDVGESVRGAAARIRELSRAEITDVVPSYTTLGVYFDGSAIAYADVVALVAPLLAAEEALAPRSDASILEIPVRYDGPDLEEVAERTGLTVDEVIARHSKRSYRAYACGFQPGFAYLGDLDEALALPRRASPRLRVPPGSVAIAGMQTAVYPLQTPGGWHIIGSTSLRMFDATREPPALIRPGDVVRFVLDEP